MIEEICGRLIHAQLVDKFLAELGEAPVGKQPLVIAKWKRIVQEKEATRNRIKKQDTTEKTAVPEDFEGLMIWLFNETRRVREARATAPT